MATDPLPQITVLDWVPDTARGLVRDLRVRWALEEVGQPYTVEKVNVGPKSAGYLARQPFGQVPAFRDGEVDLFESGAILLYLAQRHPALLPEGNGDKWRATCWMFAALNSVDPWIAALQAVNFRMADKPWVDEARAPVLELVGQRLGQVAVALGDAEWLAGRFSIADIMLAAALDTLRETDLVAQYPVLAAYLARAKERPAYQRALAAQLADFTAQPPQS